MLSKCVVVKENDAAKVKAMVAGKLHKEGFTQQDISKMLNITQPMVSRYLKQNFRDKRLDKIAERAFELMAKPKKAVFSCIVSDVKILPGKDYFVSTRESIILGDKSQVISCLVEGIEMLKDKNLAPLLPKVKVNMAMASENSKTKQDIAAIPSGLIFVDGILKSHSEPEFNSSSHLASILLYVRSINSRLRAVMNTRFDNTILDKIRKSKVQKEL